MKPFNKFNPMKPFNVLIYIMLTAGMLFVGCGGVVPEKPNFLFIVVDDQSPFDFKFYDSTSNLDSPVIDRIAQEGMIFDGARHMGSWSGAVCTPSRHMIMCGRTLWNLPDYDYTRPDGTVNHIFQKSNCTDSLDFQPIGAVFGRAGYKTMRTSKGGNFYAAANLHFDVTHEGRGKREGNDENGSAWHANHVLDYLNQREVTKETDPFFIFFGISHPHDTRDGKPELLAKYGAVNHRDTSSLPPSNPLQPVLPANYLPAHPFDHGNVNIRDEVSVSGVWRRRDEQTIRNELGRENACVENIDIQIGKVLSKLEEMGELDNTYIVYTSDHGIAIGRHGLTGKQNLYEHTWRVPFIVKGPGIAPGKRVEGNIYLLDVLPTFCDLAGVEIPHTVQGISFAPVLKGEKNSIRDVMFGVYSGGAKPGMRCVKKGDWKIIKYDLRMSNGSIMKTQLFNLAENPNEFLPEHQKRGEMETNLANNPKYADKLKEMEALLLEQMEIHGDHFYHQWIQPEISK